MSGTGNSTRYVAASGEPGIDGILGDRAWDDTPLLIGAPASAAVYPPGYGSGEDAGFRPGTAQMVAAMRRVLDIEAGTAADDGFSVEGFTDLTVRQSTSPSAHIRIAQSDEDPFGYGTAWGYYPSSGPAGGDVWFSTVSYDYTNPVAGNYANATMVHELGHALGLEHGHENSAHGTLPADLDAMEYSVMTYRSYVGASLGNYTNATWGYAQNWMMLDIAALQQMYGADFTTNGGDTVYSWSPDSGDTLVDGGVGLAPGANRIFATIWDGGGIDHYDLSAYDTALRIDLAPGAASVFDDAQLAHLGSNKYASGNIYNALLYRNDTRSLIEHATGGSGDDDLSGNQANNRLRGGAGDDRLSGRAGHDRLFGQQGDDLLYGEAGNDTLCGNGGRDALFGASGDDRLEGRNGADRLLGNAGDDVLWGGGGGDRLFGGYGDDEMLGGGGRDVLTGAAGADRMRGGNEADVFRFVAVGDSPTTGPDTIVDFTPGGDRIDLSRLAPVAFEFRGFGSHAGGAPDVVLRHVDGDTRVLADQDGDRQTDLRIDLSGLLTLAAADFIL